jgi:hypothetical protein
VVVGEVVAEVVVVRSVVVGSVVVGSVVDGVTDSIGSSSDDDGSSDLLGCVVPVGLVVRVPRPQPWAFPLGLSLPQLPEVGGFTPRPGPF